VTQPAAPAASLDLIPESFWAIVIRRSRYVLAVCASAFLFHSLGWMVAAPPPNMAGVSLLAWGGSGNAGLFAAAVLAAILLLATFICTLLTHPDAPHIGLFCALLGMTALSIRGGNVHLLYENAIAHDTYPLIAGLLALECVQWAIIFLIAETFARLLHDRFLANTRWITRSGPDLSMEMLARIRPASGAIGVSLYVSQMLRTTKMRRRIATPLAIIYSVLVAVLLLYLLLQSSLKGQVLFACFAAFFLTTINSYLAFPRVPFVAFMLAVPLTAAVGYLYGRHAIGLYPGDPGFFMARALPIDYISAGIPGAILGYYAGFRWSLHTPPETDS
jgi:hypothetical protein